MNSFRNIDPLLLSKIETLSLHPIDVYFWEAFYEFIILSYSIPLNNRFSISDLFYKLKSLNISVASDIFIILERRQIFIGDLSPDNIILSSNGEISLIDVEYYRFHQQEIPHALGTSGFWCSKYSDNHATIYAFFALWYYLSFPSEYQKLLLKQEPMYDCNIERYQSICEDMPAIIEIKDYKTILKILRDYIIGGK